MPTEPRSNPRSSREEAKRDELWSPPTLLPDPNQHPDWVFRWVRTSSMGAEDQMNVSKAMREGWEPVRAEDVPELQLQPDRNSRYPGMMEVGGLLLCKASRPVMDQRDAYYRKQAAAQLRAVEDDLMRESNPVMPIHRPERRSSVSFGHGRASDD